MTEDSKTTAVSDMAMHEYARLRGSHGGLGDLIADCVNALAGSIACASAGHPDLARRLLDGAMNAVAEELTAKMHVAQQIIAGREAS